MLGNGGGGVEAAILAVLRAGGIQTEVRTLVGAVKGRILFDSDRVAYVVRIHRTSGAVTNWSGHRFGKGNTDWPEGLGRGDGGIIIRPSEAAPGMYFVPWSTSHPWPGLAWQRYPNVNEEEVRKYVPRAWV